MVAFMLWDKPYYDYDYEVPSERTMASLTAAASDDELAARIKAMGFSVMKRKVLTPDELQSEVMADNERKDGCQDE